MGRRFGLGWGVATLGFAALGAALAAIAIGRAQYPMLGFGERIALCARWSLSAAALGAVVGIGSGLVAALVPTRRPRSVALASAALVAAALIATRGGAPTGAPITRQALASLPPPSASAIARPNLVLVTIDTLRADHLDLYGYPRATAPSLRAFAAGGVVFETAISQAPATSLAMASLLTGLWPWSHMDLASPRPEGAPYLRSGFTTLAERLANGGWDTGGFVANLGLRAAEGYAQGFAHWDELAGATRTSSIDAVLAPALGWLATAREPFLLWVHAMDPHHPYTDAPPAPWEDPGDPDTARLRARWQAMPVEAQTTRMQAVADRDLPLEPGELEFLIGRYDAEIHNVDAGLAQLFAALRTRGADDHNTLVVVTADHGEEFLDHGGMLHSHTLYDELLHIPLVVRGVGVPAGGRVAQQVRSIDIAATLLEAAGLSASDLDGRSLAALWRDPDGDAARPAISSREGKYLALRSGGRKLVVAASAYAESAPPAPGVAGLRWMARVAFDRSERPKVGYWPAADEPSEPRRTTGSAAEMREAYAGLDAERRRAPPREVPYDAATRIEPATAENLRALGYAP